MDNANCKIVCWYFVALHNNTHDENKAIIKSHFHEIQCCDHLCVCIIKCISVLKCQSCLLIYSTTVTDAVQSDENNNFKQLSYLITVHSNCKLPFQSCIYSAT